MKAPPSRAHRHWWTGRLVLVPRLFLASLLGLGLSGCSVATLRGVVQRDRPLAAGDALSLVVIREGQPEVPKLNMSLKKGDTIRTDADTTAILRFQGGSEVTLFPNTEIVIESIWVKFGEFFAKIRGQFRIRSEQVDAAVEGTAFLVELDAERGMIVTVLEGVVRLSSPTGRWAPVRVGRLERFQLLPDGSPTRSEVAIDEANRIADRVNRVSLLDRQGQAELLVPWCIGKSQEEALRLISETRFRAGRVEGRITGGQPIGTIIDQSPKPGTLLRSGQAIDLWFEAQAVKVPDVVGQPQAEAASRLRRANLQVQIERSRRITGTVEPFQVNSQNPAPNAIVPEGETVVLSLEPDYTRVPPLVGLPWETARAELGANRLRVGRTTPELTADGSDGQILEQDPKPNDLVPPNSAVSLVIAEPGIRVPPFQSRRMPRATAERLAGELGLILDIQETISGNAPAGTVVSQSLPEDSLVKRGTRLRLTVEAASVPVPDLSGRDARTAAALLRNQQLAQGRVSSEPTDASPRGTILRQNPAAGSRVPPGTPVDLVVAEEGVRIPQLLGQNVFQVKERLRQLGLVPQEKWVGDGPAGRIVRVNPQPGSMVRRGDRVVLEYTQPPIR